MDPSITIICTEADDPDQFERMSLTERRERSGGWKTFPLRSGRFIDTFFMAATDSDFGVFDSADALVDGDGVTVKTCMIVKDSIPQIIPMLEVLVEQRPGETARALVAHGGGSADPEQVAAVLGSGEWPDSDDPAAEAAAFARQLLTYARYANDDLRGVCWEFRGEPTI